MGIVNPYFPKEICLRMAKLAKADIFIETGTYYGNTAKWAATEFKLVHTIELSDNLYNENKDKLISKGNIIPYLGDSRLVLPEILRDKNTNFIFWLDGHYSAGATAGLDDPCPLLRELEIILQRVNEDIIIIDDARCYNGQNGWPTIFEIYKKINLISKTKKYFQICDDHIYIVPEDDKYIEILLEYTLKKNVLLWDLYSKKRFKISNFGIKILKVTGTYNIVGKIYKKIKNVSGIVDNET